MLVRDAMAGSWAIVRAGQASRTRTTRRRALRLEALEGRALLSVAPVAPPAPPTIFVVDQPGDNGSGSGRAGDIRYALNQANQQTGNSVIVFAPNLYGQTIDLTSGPLQIRKLSGNLAILGPGAKGLTISGSGHSQVFQVAPISHATIEGLTIIGGVGPQGAGIMNTGQLDLVGLTISGNHAVGMGGGGVANGPYGHLTIDRTTVSGNLSTLGNGGGIANSGTLTIDASTISGNTAFAASGGGIASTGTLTISESTIADNQAPQQSAGGIFNDGISSTAALTLNDDTISANTALVSGGGLMNTAPFGTVSMNNTIVDGNLAQQDARTNDIIDSGDFSGVLMTGSHDLIGAGDLGSLSSPLVGLDPMLGPLANNGGPTETMALKPASPAVNAGDPALLPAGNINDQRGLPYQRVVNGQLDIGAYQAQPVGPGFSAVEKAIPKTPPGRLSPLGLTINPDLTPHGKGRWLHLGG